MLRGILWGSFLLISIVSLIEAHFNFKLGYCRFKCVDPCKEEKVDNPHGDAKIPSGYYWRDFYGKIPPDAYPLGNSNQYPQTYIGLVYVASKNGTFVTTIVGGLDYVYVVNGTVVKKDRHIQILCTMEPERLVWFKLSEANFATMDHDALALVIGSYQRIKDGVYPTDYRHFITKISHCKVNYAGSMRAFNDVMEYALLDGTSTKTDTAMWLFYRKTTKAKDGKIKAKSFISHRYEYSIRPDSIIPSFYKQFTLGDCSITCTNEGSVKKGKAKSKGAETQAAVAMEYYWQPEDVFNPEEAMKVGEFYIGQSYCSNYNWYDVGRSSSDSGVYIVGEKKVYAEFIASQFMCSNHPELFEWVNSTSTTIDQLDKSRMIPGGEMDNGTQIFIGKSGKEVGSIHLFDKSAFVYSFYGGTKADFQVLMFKDIKKKTV